MARNTVPVLKDDSIELSQRGNQISRLVKPRVFGMETSMVVASEAKYIKATIPDTFKEVELLHITDVQWGSPNCLKDKVKEYRDHVLAKPNRFVFFGGDMMDAATLHSPGDSALQQKDMNSEQVLSFCELMAPLAHRILGYVGGNHEARAARVGDDFGRQIAGWLKIPYSTGVQHIDLYFGDWKPFKVFLWHGKGGASTKGSKANGVTSVVRNDKANLYLSGHIHDALVLPGIHVERNHVTQQMEYEKYYCVSSTSFLGYYGSYGERMFLPPSYLLMGKVILTQDGHFRVMI